MTSVLQLLVSLHCHCVPRLAWEIVYARSLAPLGRVKLSAGTAQKLTPEGYAVESESHPGSVQIYPVAALERVA